MDCKVNQESLIDFQFGNMDRQARSEVEAHLLGCSSCLEEFFLLKRDVESAHDVILKPSSQVKERIHRDFLAFAYGTVQKHPRSFIVGGLVAAAAMLIVMFSGQFSKLMHKPVHEQAPETEMVRSLNEAVDSGGENPGHINII
ncbi:MAG TPA: zf-HC2 domain-containing protein [Oligoflexus sp.]|uniref:anti-sigma factor family protein n=1 Tax=Oligoflexus sp. TaxID=1971216 RepID=UPI002D7E3C8F|nr:zf-HC2 domain-containing protein [Oligoflexus sp.]HET9240420.1 zf-HC2 domain-containing protein [Oligoflexus sp.]